MNEAEEDRVEQVVAAALCRTALLTRAAAGMTAAGVGLFVPGHGYRTPALLALIAGTTAAQNAVLTRRPAVVRRRATVLAVDSVLVLAVLVLSQGTLPYFLYAAGSAALAGVLLGMGAVPLWTALTVQGFVVSAVLLRSTHPPAAVAPFVLAAPMGGLLAGIGAVLATGALTRQMHASIELIRAAQRSAAAAERARLARELHDSVAKTLRGMSLAALALPDSLRRQPALAAQLADVVSHGADAASREARQLIEGLRLDVPDRGFADTLHEVARGWGEQTGIAVRATLAPVEPPVGERYELAMILREALTNVARHAGARHVVVVLTVADGVLTLTVRDDGHGFVVPGDLGALQHGGHVGIVGMAERARSVGGALTVTSQPGSGTVVRVTLRLPLELPVRAGAVTR